MAVTMAHIGSQVVGMKGVRLCVLLVAYRESLPGLRNGRKQFWVEISLNDNNMLKHSFLKSQWNTLVCGKVK